MTNINPSVASPALDDQLFTDLTAEQAAVVEGGAKLLSVRKIQAIRAGADTFGADDTYLTINGEKVFGPRGMSTGNTATVNRAVEFSGSATISLFDEDGFLNGDDDFMGSFSVSQATQGTQRARVSGGGSTYDVYYRVIDLDD
ncbi:hypothetical protein IFO70_23300 [Phormidium tenue FACHB-886]|nr:hypothetical protein [Phormidium tenue FACHB-886]